MSQNAARAFFPLMCLIAAALAAPPAIAQDAIDIPYEKFVLDNGLTLIVHEDHKTPIVAVNIWYHVGSKNEKPGKTGFAHLFEHLMFNGSENYNDDYFKPFDRIGATDMNGTTSADRTNYFQNVPTNALDVALWMESDRMGHLLGAITQEKLDEQRGVVQNEKRQGENQPYGVTRQLISENTYPAGHPYSWNTIGSMDDLNAASLEDVHEWFRTYYGAANAVIAIVGDIEPQAALQKVEQYFGHIPAGPPVARHETWIAKRSGTHRQSVQDRVPQARIYKIWNIPEWTSVEVDHLDLVSDLLALGKNSRLYKRLVYEDQIATSVSAFIDPQEIAGTFYIMATAQPGQDLGAVEKAIDEELARLIADGPTEKELRRVKTQHRARFIRGIERIGGFRGKANILARNEVFGGSPDFYKTRLNHIAATTATDITAAANKWLTDGVYILEVHPYPEYSESTTDVDRSQLPKPGDWPEVHFSDFQRETLSNGLEVILVERQSVPVVNFRLLLDAGYAADQFGVQGVASLALNVMDEGTATRSALEISDQLAQLGASIGAGSNIDMSLVTLSTLSENMDAALDIYVDVILNPAFPEAEFQRLKRQQLAGIQREKSSPRAMAMRVFPKLIYGPDHAYSMPLSGSGTEESVAGLTRNDVQEFHDTWFKPGNATLIVVGKTTAEKLLPKLEKLFKNWKPGSVPKKNLAAVSHRPGVEVYLLDRPGSEQSIIVAGHIAPPRANPDEIAIEIMNEVLGAGFSARINMNLREDKHWSYGARSVFNDARGQRPFFVYAPVQTDKTTESMIEIQKELSDIIAARPPEPDEVARARDETTLTLPGRWETAAAVSADIAEMVRFGYADDYWNTYAPKIRALEVAAVTAAAKKVIHPDKLVWVIVGDLEKIEAGIRALNYGPVTRIDADGNPIE